ncbi:uncharacterized protein ACBT44_013377 isoform 2-T2 [Syngnathus typhle]
MLKFASYIGAEVEETNNVCPDTCKTCISHYGVLYNQVNQGNAMASTWKRIIKEGWKSLMRDCDVLQLQLTGNATLQHPPTGETVSAGSVQNTIQNQQPHTHHLI